MKANTRQTYMLALLLTSMLTPGAVTSSESSGGENDLLTDVMSGLKKAVDFFSEDYSSINADGLFGIRVAQGTLIQSLQWCQSRCPDWLVQSLQQLNHTIGVTADKALAYVKSQDQQYYSMFHKTIDSPYLIESKGMSLDGAITDLGSRFDYSEKRGDLCFAGVMGTLANKPTCSVSEECMVMMTKPTQAGYSITHQLLYFILGEKENCLEKLDAELKGRELGSVKTLEQQFCGHIYSETKRETSKGNVIGKDQDLFLEQSLLCGVLGFQDFISPAWVRIVLGWQTWRGCFTSENPMLQYQAKAQKQKEQQGRLLDLIREEARKIDSQPSITHRKLLRERIMEGDCLSHKSGLATGLLGVYQRHLIQSRDW